MIYFSDVVLSLEQEKQLKLLKKKMNTLCWYNIFTQINEHNI